MAKNRSSSTNVLAGLVNLQPFEESSEKPIENVKEEPKERIAPIIEAAETVTKIVKKKTKTEEANKFTVYLDDEQYLFLKKNGWEFNGMNGFIKHLIDEEKKRRGE